MGHSDTVCNDKTNQMLCSSDRGQNGASSSFILTIFHSSSTPMLQLGAFLGVAVTGYQFTTRVGIVQKEFSLMCHIECFPREQKKSIARFCPPRISVSHAPTAHPPT